MQEKLRRESARQFVQSPGMIPRCIRRIGNHENRSKCFRRNFVFAPAVFSSPHHWERLRRTLFSAEIWRERIIIVQHVWLPSTKSRSERNPIASSSLISPHREDCPLISVADFAGATRKQYQPATYSQEITIAKYCVFEVYSFAT
jgi:hypothetical protein